MSRGHHRSNGLAGPMAWVILIATSFCLAAGAQDPPAGPADPETVTETTPAETAPAETSSPSVPAQLDLEITPRQITVGDPVEAVLTLVWMGGEPSAPPRFPTWQQTWGKAEVLGLSEIESLVDQSGRRIYRQKVTLTAFEVGSITLPSITVVVPLDDRTEEVSSTGTVELEVVSVLPTSENDEATGDPSATGEPAGTDLEARPAAPLAQRPPQEAFLWTAAILGLLTVAVALALIRRLRAAGATTAERQRPLLPPLQELVGHLQGIDPAAGSEPAHTALSLALRRYLGRTLAFQAVEGTTSEIQRRLRETAVPAASTQRAIRLLRDCDQVKFARQEVEDRVTDDRIRLAEALAREVEEQLRPTPEIDPADPTGPARSTPPPTSGGTVPEAAR